jgi:monoamine oxidase
MWDVIVVGAGAAGLAAARRLERARAAYRVVEAKAWIGGRALTDAAALGAPVDLGCHWLHSPAQNPFTPLAERYGFRVKREPEDLRIARGGAFLPEAERKECLAYAEACFARVEEFGRSGRDAAVSDLFPARGPWHGFFEAAFVAKQGAPLARASARDFALYVWEGDDWPVLDGLGALVARHARGLAVELETPVGRVAWGGSSGVALETPRGVLEAGAAILTVSTGVLAGEAIRFDPELPLWKLDAIEAFPMGSCNKVAFGFARNPFGALEGAVVVPDLGPDRSIEFLLRPDGRDLAVVMFNGPLAAELAGRGAPAMREVALDELARIFGSEVRRAVDGRLVAADWDRDPWILGSYAAVRPGRTGEREALARPVADRLFFAGEALHERYMGDVHGAHLSGESAAEAALAALGRAGSRR